MVPASLQAAIDLMDNAAAELQRITEKTEFALSVVTQAIRTQEAIAKGKVLKQLRDEIPHGEWEKFLNRPDVKLPYKTALDYINAASLVDDQSEFYSAETFEKFAGSTLAAMHQKMSVEKQQEILSNANTGKALSRREVLEEAKKPEVKIEKLKEKRDQALVKAEEAHSNQIRNEANESAKRYEDRIKQLESELEREKEQKQELAESKGTAEDDLHKAQKRLEQAQTDLANALEESQKLRFDEDTARSQRVSRTGNQLVLTLPQTLADVQKFIADREYFAEKTRDAIENQINTLIAYLHEHYTTDQTTE